MAGYGGGIKTKHTFRSAAMIQSQINLTQEGIDFWAEQLAWYEEQVANARKRLGKHQLDRLELLSELEQCQK